MKKLISALLMAAIFLAPAAFAQKKTEEIKIKTSAQCGMCKNRIEAAMAYEKGVVKSELDLETKELKVVYKTAKTSPDKIRKVLNDLGYDADDTLADETAYSNLPPCCKKPEDPDHIAH